MLFVKSEKKSLFEGKLSQIDKKEDVGPLGDCFGGPLPYLLKGCHAPYLTTKKHE